MDTAGSRLAQHVSQNRRPAMKWASCQSVQPQAHDSFMVAVFSDMTVPLVAP
jgi:hypothetical protein